MQLGMTCQWDLQMMVVVVVVVVVVYQLQIPCTIGMFK
jgi:hypothetical protein